MQMNDMVIISVDDHPQMRIALSEGSIGMQMFAQRD